MLKHLREKKQQQKTKTKTNKQNKNKQNKTNKKTHTNQLIDFYTADHECGKAAVPGVSESRGLSVELRRLSRCCFKALAIVDERLRSLEHHFQSGWALKWASFTCHKQTKMSPVTNKPRRHLSQTNQDVTCHKQTKMSPVTNKPRCHLSPTNQDVTCHLSPTNQDVTCHKQTKMSPVTNKPTCHLSQTYIPNSALAIRSSALAVLAVRQQNIYCSPAPSMSHSERESGQTTLP